MATYENLIHRAMRLVGILGSGETPSTTERDDAVVVLNAIINSWSAEEVSAYNIKHESFSLAPNDSTYTMGPAATFNTTTRPVKITSAATISGTFRKSMEVLPYKEAQARYNQIIGPVSEQGITVVLPSILGVDYAFPLLNLLVLPQPSGIVTIEIDSWQPLSAVAFGDTMTLPPGHEMALEYALGVRLAQEYGRPIDEALAGLAQAYKAAMVSPNLPPAPAAAVAA